MKNKQQVKSMRCSLQVNCLQFLIIKIIFTVHCMIHGNVSDAISYLFLIVVLQNKKKNMHFYFLLKIYTVILCLYTTTRYLFKWFKQCLVHGITLIFRSILHKHYNDRHLINTLIISSEITLNSKKSVETSGQHLFRVCS